MTTQKINNLKCLINKDKINFFIDDNNFIIKCPSKRYSGRLCQLFNEIGDENYRKRLRKELKQ